MAESEFQISGDAARFMSDCLSQQFWADGPPRWQQRLASAEPITCLMWAAEPAC